MHGEMLKARCGTCDQVTAIEGDITPGLQCQGCGRVGAMRPHVVWFGEMPFEMERIYEALTTCSLFLSIGTSGTIYPAAGFVSEAREAGAHTVELNLEASEGHSRFHEAILGPAGTIVPRFVEQLLETA